MLVALIFVAFQIVYPFLNIHSKISEEEFYYNPILFLTSLPLCITLALTLIASFIFKIHWSRLGAEPVHRILIVLLLGLMSWNYITADHNFYFNQWYFADRILLLLLCVASLRYPLLIFVALQLIRLIHHQYDFPLGKLSALDIALPFEFLAIVLSVMLGLLIYRLLLHNDEKKFGSVLVLVLFSLIAGCYFQSGFQKILISGHGWEWITENHISNNFLAMHNRGWLMSWPQVHLLFYNVFKAIEIPGQFFVLVSEVICLFILFNRQLTRIILISLIAMHFMIFLLNGAFFYQWIMVDIVALILLQKSAIPFGFKAGTMGLSLSILFMVLLPFPKLGWFDSALDGRFRISVNGETMANSYLSPYTRHFQHGAFLNNVPHKTLSPGFLVYNRNLNREIEASTGKEDILRILETHGTNRFDSGQVKILEQFLIRLKENHTPNVLRSLQLPPYWCADWFSSYPHRYPERSDSISIEFLHELNKETTPLVVNRIAIISSVKQGN